MIYLMSVIGSLFAEAMFYMASQKSYRRKKGGEFNFFGWKVNANAYWYDRLDEVLISTAAAPFIIFLLPSICVYARILGWDNCVVEPYLIPQTGFLLGLGSLTIITGLKKLINKKAEETLDK